MKTKEYISKFTKETSKGILFDNKGFIKAFTEELITRIEATRNARLSRGQEMEFHLFQNLVKEMEDKFWAISSKKPGVGFTPGLWNAFYAVGVIPARAKYFPKEHAEIDARRQKHLENTQEENASDFKVAEIEA